jgi:hypothetical protein
MKLKVAAATYALGRGSGERLLNGEGKFVRAFGEARHKPFGGQRCCTAAPSIRSFEVDDSCNFVIIASEGFLGARFTCRGCLTRLQSADCWYLTV